MGPDLRPSLLPNKFQVRCSVCPTIQRRTAMNFNFEKILSTHIPQHTNTDKKGARLLRIHRSRATRATELRVPAQDPAYCATAGTQFCMLVVEHFNGALGLQVNPKLKRRVHTLSSALRNGAVSRSGKFKLSFSFQSGKESTASLEMPLSTLANCRNFELQCHHSFLAK